MLQFIWNKASSAGMSVLSIVLGGILLFFPKKIVHIFSLALGAALLIYGLVYLFRYWQGRKHGISSEGALFLCLVLAAAGLLCLSVPELILSVLPFMLGGLLLLYGIAKIPMLQDVFRAGLPNRWLFLAGAILPALLGLVLLFNPFRLVTGLISFFGICLIVSGVLDLSGVLYTRSLNKK